MKFSHSIQFNAVPDWSSKYIAYTTLKKLIYSLQRDNLRRKPTSEDDLEEGVHLVDDIRNYQLTGISPTAVFIAALDSELFKIDEFYKNQEPIIYRSIEELVVDIENFERDLGLRTKDFSPLSLAKKKRSGNFDTTDDGEDLYDEDEDDDDEDGRSFERRASRTSLLDQESRGRKLHKTKLIDDYLKSPKSPSLWNNLMSSTQDNIPPQLILLSETRVVLRKRIISLYTTLSELKSFIELNQTGFKKALKKFDKSLNTHIKDEYLSQLPVRTYVFQEPTLHTLEEHIESLVKLYALVCNHSDLEAAKSELSVHLREHVVWERNTIWRDMIGLERKTYAANSNEKEKKKTIKESFDLSLRNPRALKLILILIITIILLNTSIFFEEIPQKNCFALLICASLLWATEAIPLFVTSLLIPLLIVVLDVLKNDDGSSMDATESSKYILSTMWNSVILLLLGGFTLAAALSKYSIAKLISTWILSKAGTKPSIVLLTVMGVALFASMWVSNVAAPVLCFSIIQPLLRTLPRGSQFTNALILGIALASNIGGMALPIASPQNIVAIGEMSPAPSWGQWFVIALPVCILSLVLIWLFLLATFDCSSKTTTLVPIRTIDSKFTGVQWYIIAVSILTIGLWCVASKLNGIFGEMGMIALIPIILFFGTGLLSTEDFNNYPWNIVVLAMGGTALGKAVALSGLLATIAIEIQAQVAGFSLFGVTLTFGLLILTMATFVSHTVAALIIIPLVSEVGNSMEDPHPRLLIMASALLCSAAMGLPTSGFPNVTAICMTDEFGKPYLTVGTFITRGVPSSMIAYAIIITVGYGTMRLIDF